MQGAIQVLCFTLFTILIVATTPHKCSEASVYLDILSNYRYVHKRFLQW